MRIGGKQLGNERGVVLVTALMVMALLTVGGIAALNTSDTELQISGNQRVASQAFYLAEAGIQHAVGVYKKDGLATLNSTTFSNMALGGGSYSVTVTDLNPGSASEDKFRLISSGTSSGVTRTIEAVFSKIKPTVPNIDGAFGVFGKTPTLNMKKNKIQIDGRDHTLDGGLTNDATKSKPGVYSSEAFTAPVTDGVTGKTGDVVKIGGGESPQSWTDLVANLIPNANKVSGMGTVAAPTLTYINDASKFNGGDGAGILIIEKDVSLKMNGNFNYKGIVIVLGGGFDVFNGNSEILGSVIMLGDNVNTTFSGSSGVNYSSAAITLAQSLLTAAGGSSAPINRVAWRETY